MKDVPRARRNTPEQPQDWGFFGPDSVTWRVWSHPAPATVGFQRAVVIEELDPFLVASVDQTNAVRDRPRTRYDHTLQYFATIAFGDSATAVNASQLLMKIHASVTGTEPLSGKPFDPNDPDSQLWIHLTAWHSILYSYERYGPGKLSPQDEARYWEECAIAAELQTCDPAQVPRSREGILQYFEDVRPRLAGSEVAQAMMDHLLNAKVMFPPTPKVLTPIDWVINKTLRIATVATMPRWMRRLAAVRQPRLVDLAVRPVMRIAYAIVESDVRLKLTLLGRISPSTVPVIEPALRKTRPVNPVTVTPAEAFEREGVPTPIKQYAQICERRVATG